MQLIHNWQELKNVADSDTHTLLIDGGAGWIVRKEDGHYDEYLSTHTFYGRNYEYSSKVLQEHGFNVTLANWDAESTT